MMFLVRYWCWGMPTNDLLYFRYNIYQLEMKVKEGERGEEQKKYNNLVVKTNQENTFDSRWA